MLVGVVSAVTAVWIVDGLQRRWGVHVIAIAQLNVGLLNNGPQVDEEERDQDHDPRADGAHDDADEEEEDGDDHSCQDHTDQGQHLDDHVGQHQGPDLALDAQDQEDG